MNAPDSPGRLPPAVLAALLSESVPDYLRAMAALSPEVSAEELPPLNEEDDARLWCFLEGMLLETDEAEFLERVKANSALQSHLVRILQLEVAAVPRSAEGTTARPVDFVVWLATEGLRSSARGRRQESRSFQMARSGEEASTSFQEVKLLTPGTFRVTIDQLTATSCQVTIEPETLSVPLSLLSCAWISHEAERVVDQSFAEGFVRFIDVPLGQHDFEIRQSGRPADAITVRFEADPGKADP
jgi:hypothetical protein